MKDMKVDVFEWATLRPVVMAEGVQYDLVIAATPPGASGMPGRYPTPDAALNTFSPPLKEFLKTSIRLRVHRGESVTFNLNEAFEEF